MPLFLTALVAVLRDRRARERPVLYAGATLVAIVAVLAIPFQTVINGTIVADSFSFQIFADNRTLQAISHATVLAVGVVAVIGALLLVLRSHPLIVGIGIAAAFVFMSDRLAVRIAAAANGHRTFITQRDPGMGRPGSSGDARSHDRRPVDDGSGGQWQTDYHNLSIRRLYYACHATLSADFGEQRIFVARDGTVLVGRRPLRVRYAVVPSGLGVVGHVLARDPVAKEDLIAPERGVLRITMSDRSRWACPLSKA